MSVKRTLILFVPVFASVIIPVLIFSRAFADYPRLVNRSLTIGTTTPGAETDYTFSWGFPAVTTVQSVRLELCFDSYIEDPCSAVPPGDFSGATLVNQSGVVTGFSILSTSSSEIVLTRGVGGAGTGQSTYVFENIINPTGLSASFFVRIYTYPTADASGTANHMSSVANSTTSPIVINTEVPHILFFCAALTVDEWCESVNGNFIDYGMLDPTNGHAAISQFGVATNATGGYVVTVNGSTMTSGNKFIEALNIPSANSPGEPQFGINLRANTDPPNGQDVLGSGIGVVAADYDTPDLFLYRDGDVVASAATGTVFNTYTVTYIVNIPPDQPSGIYNTTVTYICTAAF